MSERDEIRRNLEAVQRKIADAAVKSGRKPQDVKLIAVSKTMAAERVNYAIEAGATAIGENRVQELVEKLPQLLPVEAHMIGALQSNKTRQVVGKVALIHSLDRLSLAVEIDRLATAQGMRCDCLVQVNIGAEPQKSGVMADEVEPFFEQLRPLRGIRVRGLMCVPPQCSADQAAVYFRRLCKIMQMANERMLASEQLTELSMGMSGDYEQAILEGATMVRVGSAIFGKRVSQNSN